MFDLRIYVIFNTKAVIFYLIFLHVLVKTKKMAQNGTHGMPTMLNLIMLGIMEQRINVQKFAEPTEKGH